MQAAELFAREWQAGEWCLSGLPALLGLDLIRFHDGGELFGVAFVRKGIVGLSDRLDDSPMYLPVLGHECGHVLLDQGVTRFCDATWRPARSETLAWMAAGRLSISAGQVQQIDRGHLTPGDLATVNGVPAELIAVGRAVEHWLSGRARSADELCAAMRVWSARMRVLVHPLL